MNCPYLMLVGCAMMSFKAASKRQSIGVAAENAGPAWMSGRRDIVSRPG